MLLLLALACTADPEPEPADLSRLTEGLGMEVLTRAPLSAMEGRAQRFDGYVVRPVSLQVFPDFRLSAALWLPEGPGPHPAVLIAHGHFGEGKSAGETQGPGHALARAGYIALAVDTPGVEEGDLPGRRIHLAEGAHGRALLAAAGSSAMATQLHGLQAGLDYLTGRPDVSKVAVIGASGGAVQALYLTFIDPRPAGAALASFVPMPREARAGGCACDGVPGWPGPDPGLLAASARPTLWLSELEQPRPEGLPESAEFKVIPGGHGYSAEMIEETLRWLAPLLGGQAGGAETLPYSPPETLRSRSVGGARFPDLLKPQSPPRWTPTPQEAAPYTLRCEGDGPKVLLAGGSDVDAAALRDADLQPCTLSLTDDEVGVDAGWLTRSPFADRAAGALLTAAQREGAIGVFAVRAWGVAAEGAARAGALPPYVLRDPLTSPTQVDPERDPAWVHAPGWWWPAPSYAAALSIGDDPAALTAALTQREAPEKP